VGSISFITPAERSEEFYSDQRLKRAGLLLTPKTHHPHANDATRVALAFLKKSPVVPGLFEEYTGPERQAPRGKKWIPSEFTGPVQHTGALAYEPGDPTPSMPARKRMRAKAGHGFVEDEHRTVAQSVSEDLKGIWGRAMKENPAIAEYIVRGDMMTKDAIDKMAGPLYDWMWGRLKNESAGWATSAGNKGLMPTERLITLARAVLGRKK
jgi:hypothetical protein